MQNSSVYKGHGWIGDVLCQPTLQLWLINMQIFQTWDQHQQPSGIHRNIQYPMLFPAPFKRIYKMKNFSALNKMRNIIIDDGSCRRRRRSSDVCSGSKRAKWLQCRIGERIWLLYFPAYKWTWYGVQTCSVKHSNMITIFPNPAAKLSQYVIIHFQIDVWNINQH